MTGGGRCVVRLLTVVLEMRRLVSVWDCYCEGCKVVCGAFGLMFLARLASFD